MNTEGAFLEMIRIWISDAKSLGSWCIKSTDESTLDMDPSVLLVHHDPNDKGSMIQIRIIPKEHTFFRQSLCGSHRPLDKQSNSRKIAIFRIY